MMSAGATRIQTVILPKEHGGWGFILETAVIPLLIRYSLPGVGLVGMSIFVFLAHHPSRLFIRDLVEKKDYPRTRQAAGAALSFLTISAVLFGIVCINSLYPFWFPLVLALPLYAGQFVMAVRRQEKNAFAEISGAVALGAVAAAILLAGGCPLTWAMGLWAALAVRAATSIIYVRNRLERSREKKFTPFQVSGVHAAGFLILYYLYLRSYLPSEALAGFLILCGRALWGLTFSPAVVRPQTVGWQEIGFGLFNAILLAQGFNKFGML